MSGELRNFDPTKVTMTWALVAGTLDLTPGLIDGQNAISDTKDAPPWSRRGDRNSNYIRNKSSKKGGFLTCLYVAEAQLHDVLTGYAIADDQSGTIVGVIKVKDLNSTTVCEYLGAFIEDTPVPSYGDTASDRAWVFGYAEAVRFLGGATPR